MGRASASSSDSCSSEGGAVVIPTGCGGTVARSVCSIIHGFVDVYVAACSRALGNEWFSFCLTPHDF